MTSMPSFLPDHDSNNPMTSARDFDPTANSWYIPVDRPELTSEEDVKKREQSRTRQLHQISLMLHRPNDPFQSGETTIARRAPVEPNQRQYARCPVPDNQTTGILSMNHGRYHCRIVELSIGGFGVVIEGNPKLVQGDT